MRDLFLEVILQIGQTSVFSAYYLEGSAIQAKDIPLSHCVAV